MTDAPRRAVSYARQSISRDPVGRRDDAPDCVLQLGGNLRVVELPGE